MQIPHSKTLTIAVLQCCCWSALSAEAPSNYKSGIDVLFEGEAGVAYVEEYFYHDKLLTDKKVVYIRSDTPIIMQHNERNYGGNMHGRWRSKQLGWFLGKAGLDGIAGGGDGGIMRYKIDPDKKFGNMEWADSDLYSSNIPGY